ncbi:hypothetical protein DPMN_059873 [Dreissena polymorpha]|uniref:Uncharacterized protein n=1 Tax=Dreissena polymorpha TaxID=45954 RepID=A0A9D4HFD1_DREPO|nr:hypothetical protein DPMN_059873 [Dreissena polymorpha]
MTQGPLAPTKTTQRSSRPSSLDNLMIATVANDQSDLFDLKVCEGKCVSIYLTAFIPRKMVS